jgi:ubiquinone biosynthesis protein COQ4
MDTKLADNFIRLIDDSVSNGVPEIHFRFWRRADDQARAQYLQGFRNDPDAMAWFEAGYLGDDPDYHALLRLSADTLGHQYARHIIDNGLSRTLARDYRNAHEAMDASGKLDDMPAEVKYAVVRGFQIHDIFHILTGYLTDGRGEMALQAFTLAQRRLPYSSIWMATLTSQMTFKHPAMTEAVMDCISEGWQRGRSARNLNYTRWEERFDERVDDLRVEYALV